MQVRPDWDDDYLVDLDDEERARFINWILDHYTGHNEVWLSIQSGISYDLTVAILAWAGRRDSADLDRGTAAFFMSYPDEKARFVESEVARKVPQRGVENDLQ
jgi:hypothetical protein